MRQLKKFIYSVATCFLGFGFFISSVIAEPIPPHAIGIWSVSECGGEGITIQVNSSSAILVESKNTKTKVALADAQWNAGHIVLTLEDQDSEIVLPSLDQLQRCDVLPGPLPVIFAEAVAIFRYLDQFDTLCKGDGGIGRQCIEVVSNMIDVSDDYALSKAEISRVIRAASFFIGYRFVVSEQSDPLVPLDPFVPLEDLFIAQLAASTLGPYIADNIIDSYDYDGNGKLSILELTQDRGEGEGVAGIFASEVSDMAPDIGSLLLQSITDLF